MDSYYGGLVVGALCAWLVRFLWRRLVRPAPSPLSRAAMQTTMAGLRDQRDSYRRECMQLRSRLSAAGIPSDSARAAELQMRMAARAKAPGARPPVDRPPVD